MFSFSVYLYKNICLYIFKRKYFILYVLDFFFMASIRPCLALVPRTIGRRQFSLTQRRRLTDNWDQEALPGSNVPFNSKLFRNFN
jgi:hypothetical protein